jgi:hypothetical protein
MQPVQNVSAAAGAAVAAAPPTKKTAAAPEQRVPRRSSSLAAGHTPSPDAAEPGPQAVNDAVIDGDAADAAGDAVADAAAAVALAAKRKKVADRQSNYRKGLKATPELTQAYNDKLKKAKRAAHVLLVSTFAHERKITFTKTQAEASWCWRTRTPTLFLHGQGTHEVVHLDNIKVFALLPLSATRDTFALTQILVNCLVQNPDDGVWYTSITPADDGALPFFVSQGITGGNHAFVAPQYIYEHLPLLAAQIMAEAAAERAAAAAADAAPAASR